MINTDQREKMLEEMCELSITHHIMSSYTSFVIVDDEKHTNAEDAQKIDVPNYAELSNARMMIGGDPLISPKKSHIKLACKSSQECDSVSRYTPSKGRRNDTLSGAMRFEKKSLKLSKGKSFSDTIKEKISDISTSLKNAFSSSSSDTNSQHNYNISKLLEFKTADGSFTFDPTIHTDVKDNAQKLNINEKMYFNIVVLLILRKANESKYKMIVRNLEMWLDDHCPKSSKMSDLISSVSSSVNVI